MQGCGIDFVDIDEIKRAVDKYGDRYVDRMLRPDEKTYCESQKYPAQHLAARLAAKEAVVKAMGTGFRALDWIDIEISKKSTGEPIVILHGSAMQWFRRLGGHEIKVSLTHTRHVAAAIAMLV